MGDIAESLINGEFDSLTGEYIGKPVGYPRRWHKGKLRGEHEIYNHTSKNRMNGIHKYLSSKGLKERYHTACIDAYLNHINESNRVKKSTFRSKAARIQTDFGRFVKWYSQLIRLNQHLEF